MTEEEKKTKFWHQQKGRFVAIQLRTQPYVAITGKVLDMIPVGEGDRQQLFSSPVIRGVIEEVHEDQNQTYLTVVSDDPDPNKAKNKVYTLLNADRDVGYLSYVEETLIQQ